ncbi:SARP family transcriptional regulator [Actinoplanes sp. OR16]|uniref:AfsR/SARP family transcriptional regulator n=1 Tax=Actinoplanes sp. OR16 TaxID=946334 RepID=UPI000F6FB0C3|nr:BTAD domain-containing putative transcriptional regulator [Actinoplanes sp. OR16]BBH70807.1 SARP family transcriptional regulator [Actinoplanes sp. OR16]
MEFRLFGEVQLVAAGRPLETGTPRQQAVLAALAVEAGRAVAIETIVDRVWGDNPPAEARNVLYSHVSRIRRMLRQAVACGDGTVVRLERRHAGYVLDADPELIDIHRFARLAELGRDPSRADTEQARVLVEALSLWRGIPLAALTGDWVSAVRESWHRRRLDAAVHWARAELRLGRAEAVISTLPDLITEYPLAEPLEVLLMTALHTAGRDAEAMDRYVTVRQRLADALGADPGPELRALHQAILRGEPATAPLGDRRAPAQLPPDVYGFTGREEPLRQMDALLDDGHTVVIDGMAGIGKTALAVHWAHRTAPHFPDGRLYVNLRGFDPTGTPVTPDEAVRGFLDALGVPPERIPVTLDAQTALYRSLLAGRRILVLLDNARDVEQVRPLLPGAPGCMTVVTSRNQLAGLVVTTGAHPMTLDLPPAGEARQLLVRRLGSGRVMADLPATDDIAAMCGRLPLALAIVATRAATRPGLPLSVLAAELREAQGGLEEFTDPDVASDVRAVFSWSYRQLSPPAAGLFRLLGLHAGPDIGMAAAASLAGRPVTEIRPLLAELARAHLIQRTLSRYAFHDLLRAYATELASTVDDETERSAALHRVLSHYVASAHAADRLLNAHRDDPATPPPVPTGVEPERPAGRRPALDWFVAEHRVLLATLGRSGDDALVWQLAWALVRFFAYHGHWQDSISALTVAVSSARRLGDSGKEAFAHRYLGCANIRLGGFTEAGARLRDALTLYRAAGDLAGEAHTRRHQAWLLECQGCYPEALAHARQALGLFHTAGHRAGEARALNAVGWFTAMLGDHAGAIDHCERALDLQRGLGDRFGQAETWDSLGYANQRLGRHTAAIVCYRTAVALYREFDDRYNEGDTTASLGDALYAAGDATSARDAWRRAADILDLLHHPDAGRVRAKLLAPTRP